MSKSPRRRIHRTDVKLLVGGLASVVLLGMLVISWIQKIPLQLSHLLILSILISGTIGIDILQGGPPPGEL